MDCIPNAVLVLESGDYFLGQTIGQQRAAEGVLCFTTAMTGYQEAITDPSYAGQLLVFTFPHIGNVGTNECDWEAITPALKGIIVGNSITSPSNYRSQLTFLDWLTHNGISGISGVDTRSLVKVIRNSSEPLKAVIYPLIKELSKSLIEHLSQQAAKTSSLETKYMKAVIGKKKRIWSSYSNSTTKPSTTNLPKRARRIVVLDYGVKASILRALEERSCIVIVLPATASLQEILKLNPEGIVLSNGPGDPRSYGDTFSPILQSLLDLEIPLLAICFGYQLLAIALGAKVRKLNCGHHGINHPVQSLQDKKIIITSQNHEFTVEESSLPANVLPTFRSLFDGSLEGFKINKKQVLAVQFHPEGNPGPSDAAFLFDNFIEFINAKTH